MNILDNLMAVPKSWKGCRKPESDNMSWGDCSMSCDQIQAHPCLLCNSQHDFDKTFGKARVYLRTLAASRLIEGSINHQVGDLLDCRVSASERDLSRMTGRQARCASCASHGSTLQAVCVINVEHPYREHSSLSPLWTIQMKLAGYAWHDRLPPIGNQAIGCGTGAGAFPPKLGPASR